MKSSSKILAIDFGLKNIGLSISEGLIAEPFQTIKTRDYLGAIGKLKKIAKKEKISKIVIGISEGKMAQFTKTFVQNLKRKVNIPIVFWDETLTSQEAREKMLEARKSKKDRKIEEHQFAASLILQDYLDSIKNSC